MKSIANATRIGNRVGLVAKERPKPKPREICPRFQPSTITHNSSIRSRNATTRLDTDKSKLAATKKPSIAPVHSITNRSQTSKSAAATNKTVDSARNRPKSAKPSANAKSTASVNPIAYV